jgi:hypothetical protein
MATQIQTIEQIIETSFLSQKDKQSLLSMYGQIGLEKEFFDMFGLLMEKDLRQKQVQFEKSWLSLDEAIDQIQAEAMLKKESLAQSYETRADSIAVDNFTAKNELWEEYYSEMDNLEQEYERKITEATSHIVAQYLVVAL